MSILKANRIENLTTTDGGISLDNSGRIGIGTSAQSDANSNADDLVIKATGSGAGITIFSDTNNFGNIYFGDSSSAAHRGRVRYDHSNDALTLSTSANERCRILSGGGLTFNGDTAQANALDDYEEGTFTGTFNNQDNDATVSHNNQTGFYVKVGSLVHFSLYFDDIDVSSTGSINNAHIFGLPFTSLSTNFHYSVVHIIHNTILTSCAGGYVNTNSTTIIPVDEGSTTTSTFSTGTNKRLMIGGTYRAA
jgi:hypothetical protein